ncbi:Dehydrodolichyl diphosphate synthase 6 [Bienertia sinuspersici]
MDEGAGHKSGFTALTTMLRYCYELEVKYITVYAFSIDNFKRHPEEVNFLMELMRKKIEGLIEEDSIINQYGVRVHFAGDLKLLDESVRLAAEKAMAASACNSKAVLSICIAYTSTNEIMNAVQQSCEENWDELRILDSCVAAYGLSDYSGNGDTRNKKSIVVTDIEKHMYMKVALNPDIVVRTSGENRMSNFLFGRVHTLFCTVRLCFGLRLVFIIWFGLS